MSELADPFADEPINRLDDAEKLSRMLPTAHRIATTTKHDQAVDMAVAVRLRAFANRLTIFARDG